MTSLCCEDPHLFFIPSLLWPYLFTASPPCPIGKHSTKQNMCLFYLYACLQNVHCICVHVLYLNIFVQVQGNMHKNPPFLAYSSTGVEEHTWSRGSHHNQDKEHRHPPNHSLVSSLGRDFPGYSCGSIVNLFGWFCVTELILFPTFVTKASIYVALRPSPLPLG